MSTAVYITFKHPISKRTWLSFCKKHDIVYNPFTVGQNAFYWGGLGGVQIIFGEYNHDELPLLPSGKCDFSKATPLPQAKRITVGSFYMQNLQQIRDVSVGIVDQWKKNVTYEWNPELNSFFGKEPR